MEFSFRVDAIPVAQPRARATAFGGHARLYEAAKSHPIHTFKAACRLAAAVATEKRVMIQGPVSVTITAVFPRTKQQLAKKFSQGRLLHAKKPDVDNLIKAVLDSLNGIVFVDDSQVCDITASKRIAAKDEQPHVLVTVIDK